MIGHDREDSTWVETIAQARERKPESPDLVVHRDAHCLKQPGEISRARALAQRAANRFHEIVARGERRPLAASNDLAGQARGARLVAVFSEDLGEAVLVTIVEKLGGGVARSAHAHVERRAFAEGEAALHGVDLPGGDSKIEEDAIEGHAAELLGIGKISIVGLQRAKSSSSRVRLESCARRDNGVRIAIDSSDSRHATLEKRLSVTTSAERAVQHGFRIAKQTNDLVYQDGLVIALITGHE